MPLSVVFTLTSPESLTTLKAEEFRVVLTLLLLSNTNVSSISVGYTPLTAWSVVMATSCEPE